MRGKAIFKIAVDIGMTAALLAMAGSMVSGIILSRHVFSFLPIQGGRSFARNLHMVSAYWGLVVLSLHLGIHWGMMMGMAKKLVKKPMPRLRQLLRGIACLIAGYGLYAFLKREIGSYMLLKSHFVFFDFEEPLAFFLMDYIAVMGLFVWMEHYIFNSYGRNGTRKAEEKSLAFLMSAGNIVQTIGQSMGKTKDLRLKY